MQDNLARPSAPTNGHLSYKFQRLREQLRATVLSGEFAGRLPGERELGKRFNANAKTINKALCDLAVEGLITRHIGRGTFVSSSNGEGAGQNESKYFKILCPDGATGEGVRRLTSRIREILESRGHRLDELHHSAPAGDRQTLLGSWSAAARRATHGLFCMTADPFADHGPGLDEESTSEIVRRHLSTVMIGSQSPFAKLAAVVPDYTDAGFQLCTHLLQMGCRRVVVVSSREQGREVESVVSGAAAAAMRYARPWSRVCTSVSADAERLLDSVAQGANCNCDPKVGPTGIVCIGSQAAGLMMQDTLVREARARGHAHLACVAAPGDTCAIGDDVIGYDVSLDRMADWAVRLMLESRSGERPVEAVIPGFVRPATIHVGAESGRTPGGPNGRFTMEAVELTEIAV